MALLRRRRDAIDKFLADNYSDFNHSDYTPEVRQLLAPAQCVKRVMCCRST